MAPHLNDDNNVNVSGGEIPTPMAIDQPPSLQIEWNSEFTTYDLAEQHIYVNGQLKAPTCEDSDRKPIDVVVVLDRSGSMMGDKLTLCLKTVQFLMRELSPQDRLSVVSYDTTVRTDVPLTKMDRKGKAAIENSLPRIRAGSSTNLSGGLLQGLEEVQSNHRRDGEEPNPVKSVLLLTDGMANHGITSPPELVKLVDGVLNDDVSLFTFGYGARHNEALLRQLSDVGRGVYYFVENPDGVSLAFADCLGGLLSVVAQNIKLECTTKNGCEVVSIKTKKEVRTIKEGVQYEISVGDLYGEEKRDLLLELKLPAAVALKSEKKGDSSLVGILSSKLTYANVLQSSFEIQDSALVVERSSKLPTDRTPNSHVLHQKNRIVTAEAMEEATTAANRGSFGQSKAILENAKKNISVSFKGSGDLQYAQNFIQDLSACEGRVASRSAYEGGGRMHMSSEVQSHRMQRSNAVPSMDVMRMMTGASIAGSAPSNAYRSKKKSGMMRRAFNFSK